MRPLVGPHVERAALERVEPADVVEAHDVVGVAVGEDDRVDAVDAVGDALEAQLGRGVDEDAACRP